MSRRKTNEEYIEECKQQGYDLPIDNYVNSYTRIKHKCSKCGYVYEQKPKAHLQGQGCPICYGNKRKTTKEYIKECKQLGIDLPIDEYVNARTKIKHKCSKCGYVYEQKPNNHLQGQGCPICSGNKRKTPKKYKEECKRLGYDIPIEDYVNTTTKIKHKCSKCGYVYDQTPNTHLQGQGCPICCGNKRKTTKEYIKECKQLGIDLPIDEYVNNATKIYHKCKQGHVYKQTPNTHLQGHGCPNCNDLKKTTQEYYNECKYRGIDLPIEPYVNNIKKIYHKCKQGHVYKQRPNDHLHKNEGCPICNQPKGEKFIKNYLDNHNIVYESQKKFNDLKDKQPLSYDFYLPKQKVLIEYQGIQHYNQNEYFGGKEQLKKQQYHDKLKREYAQKYGYTLLEPTYKLDNQEKINKYLDNHI